MEELVQRIIAATGLDPQVAQQAVGTILGYIKQNAPADKVGDLMNAIPGADEAADANAGGGGGGIMGALGGMFGGGAGGMMALAGKLQGQGLGMDQMKSVGQQIFAFGEEKLGPDKAREIFKSIPGLSSMV